MATAISSSAATLTGIADVRLPARFRRALLAAGLGVSAGAGVGDSDGVGSATADGVGESGGGGGGGGGAGGSGAVTTWISGGELPAQLGIGLPSKAATTV